MVCRDCGLQLPTDRVMKGKDSDTRTHACLCGSRWESVQRITRRLPPNITAITATGITPASHQSHAGITPASVKDLFSGSDPIRSDLPPLILSNPGSDPERAHLSTPRRKKKTLVDYPAEFDMFWDSCESPRSKGLKSEALAAWRSVGAPAGELLVAKWLEYRASLGDGYPKDVCRWIKYRGHEEHYQPAVMLVRANGAAKPRDITRGWAPAMTGHPKGEQKL